jgi:hypothetical protein
MQHVKPRTPFKNHLQYPFRLVLAIEDIQTGILNVISKAWNFMIQNHRFSFIWANWIKVRIDKADMLLEQSTSNS